VLLLLAAALTTRGSCMSLSPARSPGRSAYLRLPARARCCPRAAAPLAAALPPRSCAAGLHLDLLARLRGAGAGPPEEDAEGAIARAEYERYVALTRTSLREVPDAEAQASEVFTVDALLTAEEVREVLDVAEEVRMADPSAVFDRSSWSTQRGEAGAAREPHWQVVFLQADHVLQTRLPHIARKLTDAVLAVDAARWNTTLGLGSQLGIRCAEVHSQRRGGGLPDPEHRDHGSLITLDVMLSDPESAFEGGQFTTFGADGRRVPHRFPTGSALVFQSLKRHGVTPVTAGERRVLVVEFWQGANVSTAGRDENQRWFGLERRLGGEFRWPRSGTPAN
jgi:predicted 2-oxoglutarate/Fe(II)-dependent dioxygenase YbiX